MARKQLGALPSANSNNTATTAYSDSTASTLQNKRITPRIGTTTSSATPAINTDTVDQFNITALATTITSFSLSGTPTDGQRLIIRIKDNGTSQGITFGSSFRVVGLVAGLPTSTAGSTSKILYVGCIYNSQDTIWDAIAAGTS